jgi:hypothetical protein
MPRATICCDCAEVVVLDKETAAAPFRAFDHRRPKVHIVYFSGEAYGKATIDIFSGKDLAICLAKKIHTHLRGLIRERLRMVFEPLSNSG